MKILRNAIECLKCKEVIVSTHVHDFRYCSCKAVAVDGGNEYLKRTGSQWDYIEASMFDARTAKKSSELEGKFLIFCPSGTTNPGAAFDRKEDAETNCKLMAAHTGQQLWYVAKLSAAET